MDGQQTDDSSENSAKRRTVWLAIGALLSIGLFAWVLRGFEFDRFVVTLRTADYRPLVLLPLAIAAEQLLRAVKWQQLLHPLGRVGVWRLFGAIVAGYFSNHIVPVRISPLVRAWLAARLEGLAVSAVLATVAGGGPSCIDAVVELSGLRPKPAHPVEGPIHGKAAYQIGHRLSQRSRHDF